MDKKINLKSLLPLPEATIYVLLSLYEPRTISSIIRFIEKESKKRALLKPEFVNKILKKLNSTHLIVRTSSNNNLEQNTSEFIISPLGKEVIELELKRLTNLAENIRKITKSNSNSRVSKH